MREKQEELDKRSRDKNRYIKIELEARKGGAHSQGKQLSDIYSIDICYKGEC